MYIYYLLYLMCSARSADTSVMATMVRLGEGVGPLTYSRCSEVLL